MRARDPGLAVLLLGLSGCVVREADASGSWGGSASSEGTSIPGRAAGEVRAPTGWSGPQDAAALATPIDDAAAGDRSALRLMTWNLEWFAHPKEGPADDAAQFEAVRAILADSRMDLIALEEVASEDAFERLLHALPRYAGVLSGYDWTQKTALLWDAERFALAASRAVSGLDDAGRPPLEVLLRDARDGRPLLIEVVHAKAQADATSHDKRTQLALGLKSHLDSAHAGADLFVMGDFNDLLEGSITKDADTPYRCFLSDPAYAAPTRMLDLAGAAESSYETGATIDHVLASAALGARVEPRSVDVLRDELLARYPDYTRRVSDHFPVTLAVAF